MAKFDFKTAMLNHGEKVAAGVFGLFGLMAVTGANWSTDPRNPAEITTFTTERKSTIEQNVWPDEDKVLFDTIDDVTALAKLINKSSTDRERFAVKPFNLSPMPAREKRSAVAMLAPEDPLADYIVFPMAKPTLPEDEEAKKSEGEEGTDGKGKKTGEEEMSEEEATQELLAKKFGLQQNTAASGMYGAEMGMAGGMPGGPGMGTPGLGGPGMGTPGLGGPGMGRPGMGGAGGGVGAEGLSPGAYGAGGGAYEGGMYGMMDLSSMYGEGMMTTKKNIRVAAGVSVRMIIDLQKQRSMIRDALHLTGDYQEAQQFVQYVDLQVERRQMLDGAVNWGEWEPVSSEDLGEILEESLGVDRDVVSPAVTRNTITMPLPRRAAGVWSSAEASHPRVEKFELSADEKALIDKFNAMVKERLEDEKVAVPVNVESKGFSKFTQSATDMGAMYGGMDMGMGMGMGSEGSAGGSSGGYDSMYSSYESQMGNGAKLTAEQRELLDETRATADHRLLLVRFMDFTVERGHTYQYRVRVEMKNPSYDHPPDELEDPSLGIEPTLVSGWSPETQEIFVPVAHRTYVTDITGRPGDQEVAGLTVYTDTTETGLPVMGGIRVLMGMPVAGKLNREVVDLTTNKLEGREVTLKADELLAAAEKSERLTTSDHPELKSILDKLEKGAKLIPDQICVVDSNGLLQMRSVGDRKKQEQLDHAEEEFILKQYDAWKPKAAGANSGFYGTEGGAGDLSGGAYGMGMGMEAASSSSGDFYGGGGGAESGRRKSSRAERREQRSGQGAGAGAANPYGAAGSPRQ